MVQLSDELLALLDKEAGRRGLSRSALIRAAVEEYLRDEREAEIDRQIIEGYGRIPPATPDEWGDLQAEGDVASAETLARLDAEERAAGLGPW